MAANDDRGDSAVGNDGSGVWRVFATSSGAVTAPHVFTSRYVPTVDAP